MERRRYLSRLDESFKRLRGKHGTKKVVAVSLTGPPASGKTHLSRDYSVRWFEEKLKVHKQGLYLPVMLIKVQEQLLSLKNALKTLRNSAYIEREKKLKRIKDLGERGEVKIWIDEIVRSLKEKSAVEHAKGQEWFLVIDGASSWSELEFLRPIWEKIGTEELGCGRMLLVLQDRLPDNHKSEYMTEIQLDPGLDPYDSLSLLQQFFPNDDPKELSRAAEKLAHIPLSIAAAADKLVSIREYNDYPWREYLEHISSLENRDEIESEFVQTPDVANAYNKTLCTVLKDSLQQHIRPSPLERRSEDCVTFEDLFFLIGACGTQRIPKVLIKNFFLVLKRIEDEDEDGENAVFTVEWKKFKSCCLITEEGEGAITIHQVLNHILRDRTAKMCQTQHPPRQLKAVIEALQRSFEQSVRGSLGTPPSTSTDTSYATSLKEKVTLMPLFDEAYVFLQQYPKHFQESRVKFLLSYTELLQTRGDEHTTAEVLQDGLTVIEDVEVDDKSLKLQLKSSLGKALRSSDNPRAEDFLAKLIGEREEFNLNLKLGMHSLRSDPRRTSRPIYQKCKKNIEMLCGDLIELGYSLKDIKETLNLLKAEDTCMKCLEVVKKEGGDFAEDLEPLRLEALLLLAQVYQDLRKQEKSAAILTELLTVCEKDTPKVPNICTVLRTLTDMLMEEGPQMNVKKAQYFIQQALEMALELYPKDHPQVAYCWMTRGRVLIDVGDIEEALESLRKAEDITKSFSEDTPESAIISLVLYFRGRCYMMQYFKSHYTTENKLWLALETTKECLEKTEACSSFGPEHPQSAYTLVQLGELNLESGQLSQAFDCFTEAVKVFKKSQGENSRHVVCNLYDRLETVCYENNDLEGAQEYHCLKQPQAR